MTLNAKISDEKMRRFGVFLDALQNPKRGHCSLCHSKEPTLIALNVTAYFDVLKTINIQTIADRYIILCSECSTVYFAFVIEGQTNAFIVHLETINRKKIAVSGNTSQKYPIFENEIEDTAVFVRAGDANE